MTFLTRPHFPKQHQAELSLVTVEKVVSRMVPAYPSLLSPFCCLRSTLLGANSLEKCPPAPRRYSRQGPRACEWDLIGRKVMRTFPCISPAGPEGHDRCPYKREEREVPGRRGEGTVTQKTRQCDDSARDASDAAANPELQGRLREART